MRQKSLGAWCSKKVPRYRAEVHKAQQLLDETDLRPMGDHFDLCQQYLS